MVWISGLFYLWDVSNSTIFINSLQIVDFSFHWVNIGLIRVLFTIFKNIEASAKKLFLHDQRELEHIWWNDKFFDTKELITTEKSARLVREINWLFVPRMTKKVMGKEDETTILCLVPELCFLTGLDDKLRSNMATMRALATHTRITPMARDQALRKYLESIRNTPKASELLAQVQAIIGSLEWANFNLSFQNLFFLSFPVHTQNNLTRKQDQCLMVLKLCLKECPCTWSLMGKWLTFESSFPWPLH